MADWHYQADGQPCTAEHFYALACDPQRHAVVEACAGAGKTWILVARMARALWLGNVFLRHTQTNERDEYTASIVG